jgi:hypothetical protein
MRAKSFRNETWFCNSIRMGVMTTWGNFLFKGQRVKGGGLFSTYKLHIHKFSLSQLFRTLYTFKQIPHYSKSLNMPVPCTLLFILINF